MRAVLNGLMAKSNKNTAAVGIVVTVMIVAAVAAIGYFQVNVAPGIYTTTPTTSTQAPSCTPSTCVNISILQGAAVAGAGYGPATVTVVIGHNSTVVWKNDDSAAHTVTARDNSFDSGNMVVGGVYTHTFTVAGTYTYKCDYHANMQGTIIVKSA